MNGFAPLNSRALVDVAAALQKPYKELEAAAKAGKLLEKDVQAFTKTLYKVLEDKAPRANTVVADTSQTGLGGGKNKVDHVACDRYVCLCGLCSRKQAKVCRKPTGEGSSWPAEAAVGGRL